MALANQHQALLLGTSNKSELAVGYTTLYGDMNGAYSVLKDVYKTQVYALALYRNAITPAIPLRVLTRAPTAELKENQTDQDSLPPYDQLDAILQGLIEHRWDAAPLIERGFSPDIVHWVIKQLWQSEYKRRQAPPGPKISSCSFGRDWRMPLMKG